MTTIDPSLATLLAETQTHTGLPQSEFSRLIGISPRTLQNWLKGVYSVSGLKEKGVRLTCYALKQNTRDYPVKKTRAKKAA